MSTKIEWTQNDDGSPGKTWNPTTGCDRVSPGCDICYAMIMAKRLKGMGSAKYQNDGNPRTCGPGFGLTVHPDALDLPLRWRKPQRVFVNSMSDLFHETVGSAFIAAVFDVMRRTPQHTYQILTKRHARMKALMKTAVPGEGWPLPNVHLGVSVEDQKRADLRIPALLETPAAVRFISAEPLLGPVDLTGSGNRQTYWLTGKPDWVLVEATATGLTTRPLVLGPRISWVIAGGESGHGARPLDLDWVRSLRDQCTQAGVPFFLKQIGGRTPKAGGRELDGRTWDEFPARTSVTL